MSSEIYRKLLVESQAKRSLVAIYTNERDPSRFSVGFVKAVDQKSFTLACVSPHGSQDGTYVAPLSAIARMEFDSRYLRRIALLMANPRCRASRDPSSSERPEAAGLIHELRAAKRHNQLVSIELCSSLECEPDPFHAFVRQVGQAHVELLSITAEGEPDGLSIVPLERIEKLTRNDEESKAVSLYYKNRIKLYGGD